MRKSKFFWDFAIKHLNELRTSYGFLASDKKTGLYATLFGRDSLWIIIFLLKSFEIAKPKGFRNWLKNVSIDILSSLSNYQGVEERIYNDEQPGKIIHEYRNKIDERLQKMDMGFYEGKSYSGFDQTILFIIFIGMLDDIFPDIVTKYWENFMRAVSWLEVYADFNKDGFFENNLINDQNILNQSWRDSYDSITKNGLQIPKPPIAWLSFQAYAYRAYLYIDKLLNKHGNLGEGKKFLKKAKKLKDKVNDQFWIEEENCFAIALDGDKKILPIVNSDAGHALWSGVVRKDYEERLVKRLLQRDNLTNFGLRSISSNSPYYSPFSYHRGTVWPFDNAIFVMGLYDKGYYPEAKNVIRKVMAAIEKVGSPIELYVVIDPAQFIIPKIKNQALLLLKPYNENMNQGWTAAGLALMAAVLSNLEGKDL